MPRTRRTYTPEFKAEAVRLVTEQGHSVAEAARSLGFDTGELKNVFPEFEVLRHEEPVDVSDYGLEKAKLVRMVARKKS